MPNEDDTNPPDAYPKPGPCPPSGDIKVGSAAKFWLELRAYPTRDTRSLWLLVDQRWCRLDDPSDAIQASVQSAFGDGSERLEVVVWYQKYDKKDYIIIGLVVRSRGTINHRRS